MQTSPATTRFVPVRRAVAAPNAAGAIRFSMRGLPLLSEGASFDPLGTVENLWLSVKVYSSGGENALHAHRIEDHTFVVMQGRAIFSFGDGSSYEVRQFEGVIIPKGTMYRFEAGQEENLVLLRVGGAQRKNPGQVGETAWHGVPSDVVGETYDSNGAPKDARAAHSGTPAVPIKVKPGEYFARE